MLLSAVLTGVLVFLILTVELYGFRKLERVIVAFVFGIAACYALELFLVDLGWADWKAIGYHTIVPQIDSKSIYIAVGMLGATVMPHVVYLHSALVQHRVRENEFRCPTGQWLQRLPHVKYELIDVLAALNGAWLINSAMISMAAAVTFRSGHAIQSTDPAHAPFLPLLPTPPTSPLST